MKYKNWPEDKKIPKYMEVIDGWVMPEDVAAFFPGQECFDSWNPIFYLHDDLWWDLKAHKITDN